jgi:aminoglycoside phosphotransferase family enzyme
MEQQKLFEALKKPSLYGKDVKSVNVLQTHISFVVLTGRYVYKIKKAVNFGFLDFSSLEKRRDYCKKEVELNSRFSKDVYLGVYPVTFDGKKYAINGKGEVVDYAVKMRQLSEEDLMKSRFRKGTISSKDIERIGEAIANFHKTSARSKEIDEFGKLDAVKFNTDENFQQTAEFIGNSISKEQYKDLKNWTDEFYKEHQELFAQRVKDGKISDCHGDLHMEHVCLTDPIIIFDCIEFNDRFRYSDILSDTAFLLMDLEFNGGKMWSEQLCKKYLSDVGEKDDVLVYSLIKFYKVYRAYVRGKVTSFILKDSAVPDDKKIEARSIAQRYFALAHSYILE